MKSVNTAAAPHRAHTTCNILSVAPGAEGVNSWLKNRELQLLESETFPNVTSHNTKRPTGQLERRNHRIQDINKTRSERKKAGLVADKNCKLAEAVIIRCISPSSDFFSTLVYYVLFYYYVARLQLVSMETNQLFYQGNKLWFRKTVFIIQNKQEEFFTHTPDSPHPD